MVPLLVTDGRIRALYLDGEDRLKRFEGGAAE